MIGCYALRFASFSDNPTDSVVTPSNEDVAMLREDRNCREKRRVSTNLLVLIHEVLHGLPVLAQHEPAANRGPADDALDLPLARHDRQLREVIGQHQRS